MSNGAKNHEIFIPEKEPRNPSILVPLDVIHKDNKGGFVKKHGALEKIFCWRFTA